MRKFLAFFCFCFACAAAFFSFELLSVNERNQDITIIIEKNSSSKKIVDLLHENNIIEHPYSAYIGVVILKLQEKYLKHGEYIFPPSESLWDILNKISKGLVVKHMLTIPEGLTVREIVNKLNEISILNGDIKNLPEEGELLPQTYDYYYGDSKESIIKRMRQAMLDLKISLWDKRKVDEDLELENWEEVLTLASIVEKETSLEKERPIVASVYLNRLRKGMRLQADPTVIYAITGGATSFARPISKSDLTTDSDFNTYLVKGLTPTPIACPGEASIKAVLNPADTNYIYFVADGNGGHSFSSNLQDHNKNVKKWKIFKKNNKR